MNDDRDCGGNDEHEVEAGEGRTHGKRRGAAGHDTPLATGDEASTIEYDASHGGNEDLQREPGCRKSL